MNQTIKIVVAILIIATITLIPLGCSPVEKSPLDDNAFVFSVGEREVYADEFIYYLLPYKDIYQENNPDILTDDYARQQLFKVLIDNIKQTAALLDWARDHDIKLDDTDYDEIQDEIQLLVEQAGNETLFETRLASDYMTLEVLTTNFKDQKLGQKIREYILSDESPYSFTEQQKSEFIESRNVLAVQFIFISYETTAGLIEYPSSIQKSDDIKQTAEQIYQQYIDGEDFTKLVEEYSKDGLMVNSPEGYTYYRDQELFLDSFVGQAVNGLEIGEVSEILENEGGFYIVKRTEPIPSQVKEMMSNEKLLEETQKYIEQNEVVYSEDFDLITFEDIYFRY